MQLVIRDIREILSDASLNGFRSWVRGNTFTMYVLPTLLAIEGLVLYGLYLFGVISPGVMAGIGALFFFLSFMWFTYAWSIGQELSTTKASPSRHYRVHDHVAYTDFVGAALLAGVVAIECAVRAVGGLWGPGWLLAIHLTLVVFAVVSFIVAKFVLTGLKRKDRHGTWVRIFGVSYLMTLFTGSSLILIKFPLT